MPGASSGPSSSKSASEPSCVPAQERKGTSEFKVSALEGLGGWRVLALHVGNLPAIALLCSAVSLAWYRAPQIVHRADKASGSHERQQVAVGGGGEVLGYFGAAGVE